MKIITVLGTRPEMIKLSQVIKKIDENPNVNHILVHTGQNFTKELKDFFFTDLKLRDPDYYLNINTSSYGDEVSDIIKKTHELFIKEKPDQLLILGDTYSCLSIMPAASLNIKIFHMEAGLRAWDKRMPEQRNRILIDHMSDVLLPFNQYHRENLIRENIHPSKIFVTGNPTFEVLRNFQIQIDNSNIVEKLNLIPKKYFLLTFHRSENVDNPAILERVILSLNEISKEYGYKIVYPVHPRTKKKLKNLNLKLENFILIDALGYYDYNSLTKNSFCILSDSGTAPEEGLLYKIPSVTIRDTSERYEVVESGLNIVSGTSFDSIKLSISSITHSSKLFKYDLESENSPSDVVLNILLSNFKHYF